MGSEVGYSLEEVSSCVSFKFLLRGTLTTAEGHEVRCSVPRHLVEVVELVCDFRDGCAEDCLGVDILWSAFFAHCGYHTSGVTNIIKRHEENAEQQ